MAKKVDYRYKELAEHFGLGKKDRVKPSVFKHKSMDDIRKDLYNISDMNSKEGALLLAVVLEQDGKVWDDSYVKELNQNRRGEVLKALMPNHLKSEALQQLVRTAPNNEDKQLLVNLMYYETVTPKKMAKLENAAILQRLDALAALSKDGHLNAADPAVSSLHTEYVKEVINRHADKEKNPLSIGILVTSMQHLQELDRANVVDLMSRELRTGDLAELQINPALTVEERTKIIAAVVERSNLKKVSNDTIMYAVAEGLLDEKTSELIFTKKGREFAKDAEHIGGMLEAVSNTESRIKECGQRAIYTMLEKVGNDKFREAMVLLSNSEKLVPGNLKDTFELVPTERLTKAFGYTKFLNDVNMEQMRDGIIAAGNKEMAAALFKKLDDKGMYDKLEILVKQDFFKDIAKEQIKSGKMSVAAFEHLVFRDAIEVEITDLPTKQDGGLTRIGDKYNNRLFVNEHINTDQVSRSEKFRYNMIFEQGRAPGVIERIKNRLSGKSTQMFPSDRGEEYDYILVDAQKAGDATTATMTGRGVSRDSGVTGDTASDRTADAVKVVSELNATRSTTPAAPPMPVVVNPSAPPPPPMPGAPKPRAAARVAPPPPPPPLDASELPPPPPPVDAATLPPPPPPVDASELPPPPPPVDASELPPPPPVDASELPPPPPVDLGSLPPPPPMPVASAASVVVNPSAPPPPPMPGSGAPAAPKAPPEADQAQVKNRGGLLAQINALTKPQLKKVGAEDKSTPQQRNPEAKGGVNPDLAAALSRRRGVFKTEDDDYKAMYKDKDDKYLENAKKFLEEQSKEDGKSEEDKRVINEKLKVIEEQMKKNQKAAEAQKEAAEASRIRDEEFQRNPYKDRPIAEVLEKKTNLENQIAGIDRAMGVKFGVHILTTEERIAKQAQKVQLSKELKEVQFALDYRSTDVIEHKAEMQGAKDREKEQAAAPQGDLSEILRGSPLGAMLGGGGSAPDRTGAAKGSWEERVLKGAAGNKEKLEALQDKYSAKNEALKAKEDVDFLSDEEEKKQQKWKRKIHRIKEELAKTDNKGPGGRG